MHIYPHTQRQTNKQINTIIYFTTLSMSLLIFIKSLKELLCSCRIVNATWTETDWYVGSSVDW